MLAASVALALTAYGPNRLVGVVRNVTFPPGRSQRVIANLTPGFAFDEVIPSWSIAGEGAIGIEIRVPAISGGQSRWYSFGTWSADGTWIPRESVKEKGDADGGVSTDTFVTKGRPRRCDLRLTLTTKPVTRERPRLKHLSLSFSDTTAPSVAQEPNRAAWGHFVDVPERAQGNYPRGGVLCSATSTSMLLSYYSQRLNRPEIDRDVPDVEAGVWDRVYKGAGNWPFNTAYFGAMEGLIGYVTRLDGISDLETLT
ncbi:MAG: hypothetical protein C4320_10090, partial [Armatimonadota bacterium]